jgi:hypothetical protein
MRRLIHARRGYQDMLSSRLGSVAGGVSPATAALVSCAALFEELLPVVDAAAASRVGASGISAAAAVYQQALAALPLQVCWA